MPRFVADLDLTQIMTSARERVAQLAPSGVKLISKKSTVAIFRTDRDKQAMGLVGTFSIADHPDEAWEVRWNEIMDMRVIRKKRSSLK